MTIVQDTRDMVTPERRAGQRGAKHFTHEPTVAIEQYRTLAPTAVVVPETWDQTGGLTHQIGMLGNDGEGDCVVAAFEHGRMFKALVSFVGGIITWAKGFRPAHAAYTLLVYWTYGRWAGEPGLRPDNGANPLEYAKFAFAHNLTDAFGLVDLSDPSTKIANLKQAAVEFGGLLVCVDLTDDAMGLFNSGQTWNVANGQQPNPQEGHGIWLDKFDSSTGLMYFATWGFADQSATEAWVAACVTSAIAFISKEQAAAAGVDGAALIAACQALIDGQGSPVPMTNGTVTARQLVDGASMPRNIINDIEVEWDKFTLQLRRVVTLAVQRESVSVIARELGIALKMLLKTL